jgi:hypothetical protein
MRRLVLTVPLLVAFTVSAADTRPADGPAKPPPAPPVPPAELDAAIARGIAFLVKAQNADGSFGGPGRTKDLNIFATVPGSHHAFQTGATALAVSALIETGGEGSDVRLALEKAENWLLDRLPRLRRATEIELYNVWGHCYGIQALVRMHGRAAADRERQRRIEAVIRGQVEMLARYESVDGGWGYYDFKVGARRPATDSTSFVNAAVLVALAEAKQLGVEPPAAMVRRAVTATVRQRKPDFSYLYGEDLKYAPMHPINRPGGSLGRSQACNVALRLWGDAKVTDGVLTAWLNRLIVRNGWLDHGRKRPIPHESRFAVAGYFYYFGHYYAALCVEQLPPADRTFYQDHLARLMMERQEADGSWWDFPLYDYHQPYGTGFALMTLQRCKKAGPAKP